MRYTRLFIYFILTTSLLFACKGEDGEPGPQGEQGLLGPQGVKGDAGSNGTNGQDGEDGVGFTKKGFFEGTVSGNKQNGTAFSETFKYEYSNSGLEAFVIEDDYEAPTLGIYRSLTSDEDSPHLNLELDLLNKGEPNESLAPYAGENKDASEFSFYKEVTASSLFVIDVQSKFRIIEFVHPINPTLNNSTYRFLLSEYGFSYRFESNEYIFRTTENKKVYFDSNGDFIEVRNANGSLAANSPYDQLRWIPGDDVFNDLIATDLSLVEQVPADVLTITNYLHDPTTGTITFDFTLNIGALGRYNTTRHPLTITGKFNSGDRIYTDVGYRKANPN